MTSRVCQITNATFQISSDEEKAIEFFKLPLPSLCPEERYRRLSSFVSGRKLFWRNCDATKKRIFTCYPPVTIFPVYDVDIWNSDNWDPLSFGRNYSLRRNFFEQLFILWQEVPRPSSFIKSAHNISAVNGCTEVSECYYIFDSSRVRQSFYSVGLFDSILCADCLNVYSSELCYDCVDVHHSRELRWSESCVHCSSSYFLANCKGCKNCLFCVNLADKQYHIFNKAVSAEEYNQTIAAWNFSDRFQVELAKEQFSNFCRQFPVPHIIADKIDKISGNYIYQSNQIIDSFECAESSQLINCHNLFRAKGCIDGFGFGDGLSNAAQFVNVGSKGHNIRNCIECSGNVNDLTYCANCHSSRHLFGCVGLRDKEYCILNKQYSKGAYFELIDQIDKFLKEAADYGQFFPPRFSGYPYNVSLANETMPLSRVQAKLFGFNWSEEAEDMALPSEKLKQDDRLADVPRGLVDFSDAGLFKKIFIFYQKTLDKVLEY